MVSSCRRSSCPSFPRLAATWPQWSPEHGPKPAEVRLSAAPHRNFIISGITTRPLIHASGVTRSHSPLRNIPIDQRLHRLRLRLRLRYGLKPRRAANPPSSRPPFDMPTFWLCRRCSMFLASSEGFNALAHRCHVPDRRFHVCHFWTDFAMNSRPLCFIPRDRHSSSQPPLAAAADSSPPSNACNAPTIVIGPAHAFRIAKHDRGFTLSPPSSITLKLCRVRLLRSLLVTCLRLNSFEQARSSIAALRSARPCFAASQPCPCHSR
jgi:hypothetical protein